MSMNRYVVIKLVKAKTLKEAIASPKGELVEARLDMFEVDDKPKTIKIGFENGNRDKRKV